MLIDLQNILSDKQAITVTALSTNGLDIGVTGVVPGIGPSLVAGVALNDPGRGEPVDILCQVTTAFTAAGAATLQVQLIIADDAALVTNVLMLQESNLIPKALLVPGYKFRLGGFLPPGITQRFIGLNFIVGTGPMTAGNVMGALVFDTQTNPIV